MTVLLFALGVVLFVLAIGASIAWHELGHLIPAKRFGVRVSHYMVGFGPTIWSRTRGETEYGIKAVPLGGYIRMIGMFPPRDGDAEGTVRASSTGRFSMMVDEARKASAEEMRPGDENRVFYKLSSGRKIAVMLGGPVMNLVLGLALLTVVYTVHGIQTPQGAKVEVVNECVVPVAEAKTTTTCTTQPKAPANLAGIKPGDVIVSIAGMPIVTNSDVGKAVRPRTGQPTEVVLLRDGRRQTVTLTPALNTLLEYDAEGRPVLGADGKPLTVSAGFLGISSSTKVAYVPQPASAIPGILGTHLVQTAQNLAKVPEKMSGVFRTVFEGAPRDPESPMSVVGVGRIAGEVTAGDYDWLIGGSVADKAFLLLSILASLNLLLFAFNLIPLLPLDGGQVAGALWEAVKRRGSRLLGRPDPGHVDVAKALPLAYGVSMVLIGATVLLVWADLVSPVKFGG